MPEKPEIDEQALRDDFLKAGFATAQADVLVETICAVVMHKCESDRIQESLSGEPQVYDIIYDSHSHYKKFKKAGFTEDQAVLLMNINMEIHYDRIVRVTYSKKKLSRKQPELADAP